ncbi:MAG: cyclic nucleotide-binding domain-containing protein [Candidatus Dadabacteria bacterium]|nr:MAG: cyclic nucleotide-binding domain-containing protein [Candidatus Dadabacteria bacterium]
MTTLERADQLHKLERISGPAGVAFRQPGSRYWTVVPASRLPDGGLPLGLRWRLSRPDAELRQDPGTTRSVLRWRSRLPVPRLPLWLAVVLMIAVVALGIVGIVRGQGVRVTGGAGLTSWRDLGVAAGMWWLTWALLTWFEASLLAARLQSNVPWAGFAPGPRVERVVYRLNDDTTRAILVVLSPLPVLLAALSWWGRAPAVLLGVSAGAIAQAALLSCPFIPGPGSFLFGRALGVPDVANQLRWALVSHLMTRLPVGRRIRRKAQIGIAVGFGWLATALAGAGFLVHPAIIGSGSAAMAWRGIVGVLIVAYLVRVLVQVRRNYRYGLRLQGRAALRDWTPDEDVLRQWREQSALIRHVPALADAPWRWALAPAGMFLIRRGEHERRFYWIASGRAHVIRQDSGVPIHAATLGAGTGVGEIGLLDGRLRTADVVIAETAVVAWIDYDGFTAALSPDAQARFREVIEAGHSLSRSDVFFGMPDPDRERWIANGHARHYDPGDVVIYEGSDDRWIGLLVSGRLAVERGEATIAELEPDQVFGEIAWLTGLPRTATLRALEPTLVWRWDPDWLSEELARAGILDALRTLAEERLGL